MTKEGVKKKLAEKIKAIEDNQIIRKDGDTEIRD